MTAPRPLGEALGQLAAAMPSVARQLARSTPSGELDEIYAAADRAALAQQEQQRREIRNAAYVRQRPPEYSAIDYAALREQQNPRGQVSGWLASGDSTLLLMGPSWHGKTAAAYAIGNDAISSGMWVEAWFVPTLAELVGPTPRHLWDDTAHAAAVADTTDRAARCDLLILDDLGREDSREGLLERWRAQLLIILNERAGDRRFRTIVTGNSADRAEVPKRIGARYGTPVLNRLLMDSARVWVEGEPFRTRERDLFDAP